MAGGAVYGLAGVAGESGAEGRPAAVSLGGARVRIPGTVRGEIPSLRVSAGTILSADDGTDVYRGGMLGMEPPEISVQGTG